MCQPALPVPRSCTFIRRTTARCEKSTSPGTQPRTSRRWRGIRSSRQNPITRRAAIHQLSELWPALLEVSKPFWLAVRGLTSRQPRVRQWCLPHPASAGTGIHPDLLRRRPLRQSDLGSMGVGELITAEGRCADGEATEQPGKRDRRRPFVGNASHLLVQILTIRR